MAATPAVGALTELSVTYTDPEILASLPWLALTFALRMAIEEAALRRKSSVPTAAGRLDLNSESRTIRDADPGKARN